MADDFATWECPRCGFEMVALDTSAMVDAIRAHSYECEAAEHG